MIKRSQLSSILTDYRSAFIAVAIFGIFINLFMLTIPLYMLQVFTRVITSRSIDTLIMLTIAAGGVLLVQAVIEIIRSRLMVRVGAMIDKGQSGNVLGAILNRSAGSTQRDSQGLRDLNEVRTFLTGPTVFTLFDAPFAPFYVAVIYLLHPTLGTIALVGSIMLFAIGFITEVMTRKPLSESNVISNHAMTQVDGYVRNADVIKAMGMLPAVTNRWNILNNEVMSSLSIASDRAGFLTGVAKFVRMALQIALFGAGAYYFILNEMLLGAMIAAAILMGRALAPVEGAISTWNGLVSTRAAYSRLKDTLNNYEKRVAGMSLPRPEGHLSIERVVVTAPGSDQLILKGVSFNLKPGELIGVIGPSGAGKTTLGKVIVGVLTPRGGVTRLDGANILDWTSEELGQYIGYLPQDVQLFSGTVASNIARMSSEFESSDVVEAAKVAGVHDLILRLPKGYDTDIGDSGLALSAGQRQHVALARALYRMPRLIVLDEPNSNLDSISEQALVNAMSSAKNNGAAVVVISHRPSILGAADKMLALNNGVVEMFAPREEVMARMTKSAPKEISTQRGKADKPVPLESVKSD